MQVVVVGVGQSARSKLIVDFIPPNILGRAIGGSTDGTLEDNSPLRNNSLLHFAVLAPLPLVQLGDALCRLPENTEPAILPCVWLWNVLSSKMLWDAPQEAAFWRR